jgi:hypothetical protein
MRGSFYTRAYCVRLFAKRVTNRSFSKPKGVEILPVTLTHFPRDQGMQK